MKVSAKFLSIFMGFALTTLIVGCEDDPPKRKVQSRETIGKTTQEVRDLKAEISKGGQVTDGKIHATDYITIQADAYRTTVAKIAKMRVQADINLYEAANDTKIKTYDEFMQFIIKKGLAEGIQLPMLPFYQEYGYDSDKAELVVIEYPAKKKEFDEQWDKELGREKK